MLDTSQIILGPWEKKEQMNVMALWNEEVGKRFPMSKRLLAQNSFDNPDVYFEGSRVAKEKDSGRLVGFCVTKIHHHIDHPSRSYDKRGWVQTLLVRSSHRGRGIGTLLLNEAEASLRRSGIRQVQIGADFFHYFPGVPSEDVHTRKWFEKKGYVPSGEEFDLLFEGDNKWILSEDPSVRFPILKPEERDRLLTFLSRTFPGRWEYEAHHYFRSGGTGREFIVAKENENIIGFCRINDPSSPVLGPNVSWYPSFNGTLGGIGPLGISPEYRGKGLGKKIVARGMRVLFDRGVSHLVIDWTTLVDFYSKLGFSVWKSYTRYQKEWGSMEGGVS
ncbi:GNAT family N-acetyltransferase [Fictibacillus sp. B-59209]|uniref:GNAT family N-acetyltransferase n=1 Tax=Fictibacillus sp. B-59209 TaxID=3024873 RepID=UPI002E234A11|nr:GNAT family N-acetyltransferase [Fictibacillus sp. B-59209]